MRKKIGISFVILGLLCLLTAVLFVVYNRHEEDQGEVHSQVLLHQVLAGMDEAEPPETQPSETVPDTVPQMQTVAAGEDRSIGILSIPVLELELPVLTDWSDQKLKKAPCLYYGSCYEPNFVIAAHNYKSHFGRIRRLVPGDLVLFTDVTGQVYVYEVVLLETLPAAATEQMITSGFDLSLYTCTLGGNNRVTVRCSAVRP